MLTAHDSKPTTNPSAPSADSTPSPPRIDLSSRGPPRSKSEKAERNDPAANTPMMNTGRTSSSRVNSSGQKRRRAARAPSATLTDRPLARASAMLIRAASPKVPRIRLIAPMIRPPIISGARSMLANRSNSSVCAPGVKLVIERTSAKLKLKLKPPPSVTSRPNTQSALCRHKMDHDCLKSPQWFTPCTPHFFHISRRRFAVKSCLRTEGLVEELLHALDDPLERADRLDDVARDLQAVICAVDDDAVSLCFLLNLIDFLLI